MILKSFKNVDLTQTASSNNCLPKPRSCYRESIDIGVLKDSLVSHLLGEAASATMVIPTSQLNGDALKVWRIMV